MTLVLPRQVRVADPVRVSGLVIGALGLGAIATAQPRLSMAVALGLSLVAVVAARPVVGVYLLVVLTPLTAGIDRGTLVPVLRPNEALCGLVAMALLARGLVRLRTARDVTFRVDPMLGAVLALAMTSSVVPLLWMRVQGHAVTSDDVLYALLMWKYVVVFLIVRAAKLTEQQIWRTLFLSVATAAVISAISLLQTAGWAPVVTLLKTYFTTNDNVEAITSSRGSSTLGLPIAVADLLTFNLAIVMGVIWLRRRTTALLLAAAFMLTLGVVVLCVLTRSAFSARFLLIGGAISIPVLWPVIETRLAGFQSLSGLPISWTGRLDNLRSYFWPVLFSEHRYLLGVRPAARVPAPHRANGFIWIESGYTWLLWAGGIPLLLAFVWFVVVACRVARQAIRSDSDAKRITGLATFVAVSVISVLMIFDPHLTYRGVADELFALLALSTTAVPKPTPEEPK
jgi:hypothetical protein